jgi:negative regulator of sigma E activity
MAYADGEIDADQRALVESQLARDPEAREMVERFRATGGLLRENFDSLLTDPVPQRLIDTVRETPIGIPPDNVISLRKAEAKHKAHNWPSLALAAGIALVVGVVVGNLLPADRSETIALGPDLLQTALDSNASGVPYQSDDAPGQVTPTSTFRTEDGRICREFERTLGQRSTVGIACRSGEAQWFEVVEFDRTLLVTASTGSDYAPASGEGDPLTMALDLLGAGPAMTYAEEQSLRASGWR